MNVESQKMPGRSEIYVLQKDPTPLSHADIVNHQADLISEWRPESEVLSLKYGCLVVGAAASISGVLINSFFRQKLRLRNLGAPISTLALAIGPGAVSATVHKFMITNKILVFEPACAMCLDGRAALLQYGTALLYPMIVAPALNLGIAGSNGLRVPHWFENRELLRFFGSVLRPRIPALTLMLAFNTVVVFAVTHHELLTMNNIQNICEDIEKKMHQKNVEHFQ